jgi:hypothetical protein
MRPGAEPGGADATPAVVSAVGTLEPFGIHLSDTQQLLLRSPEGRAAPATTTATRRRSTRSRPCQRRHSSDLEKNIDTIQAIERAFVPYHSATRRDLAFYSDGKN